MYIIIHHRKKTIFSCRHCECDFEDYDQLFTHVEQRHPLHQQGGKRAGTTSAIHHTPQKKTKTSFSCKHCECEFEDYDRLFAHVEQRHPLHQQGGKRARTSPTINASERLNNITENQLEDGSADNVKNTADAMIANDAAANNSVAADTTSTEATLRGDIHENEQAAPQDESALGNRLVNRYILPRRSERYEMLIFFSNVRDRLRNYLQSRARELGGIEWN